MNGDEVMGPVTFICSEVGRAYGVSLGRLVGPQRVRSVTWPRQVAMYVAYELTGHSTTQIGRVLGGRDHSTVLQGIRRVRMEMDNDPAKKNEVARVREAIHQNTFLDLVSEALTEEHRERLIASLRQTIAACTLTLRRLGVEDTHGAP